MSKKNIEDNAVIPVNTKSEMLDAVFFKEVPLRTKTLNVNIFCQAYYNSSIKVPIELTKEEALEYAAEHLKEIPLGELEYISDSDELDYENSGFDED